MISVKDMPVLTVHKANANDINKRYTDLLKEAKVGCFFNNKITESILDQYRVHIKEPGFVIFARNLISGTWSF